MSQFNETPQRHSPSNAPNRAFEEALAAFRYAQARWNLALYAPGMLDKDVPQEENDRLCDDTCRARDRFIQTPAPSLSALVRKLRIFQEEELQDSENADELVGCLVNDAAHLLRDQRRG